MRVFLLAALTMCAFAANSILTRAALADGDIDPVLFGSLRLLAGAVALAALMMLKQQRGVLGLRTGARWIGVVSLLAYMYGFSAAYLSLDAGLGALILFGVVQITMFAAGLRAQEVVPAGRWLGAALAFGGLIWLLWPGAGPAVSVLHGAMMVVAGVAWGIYSLAGRQARDPLGSTAANFLLAAPLGLVATLLWQGLPDVWPPAYTLWLAIVAGAVMSGLGYALWYAVLPAMQASTASVTQLSVPVIAMAGGAIFLSEPVTAQAGLAAVLVLGGVALSLSAGSVPKGRS